MGHIVTNSSTNTTSYTNANSHTNADSQLWRRIPRRELRWSDSTSVAPRLVLFGRLSRREILCAHLPSTSELDDQYHSSSFRAQLRLPFWVGLSIGLVLVFTLV